MNTPRQTGSDGRTVALFGAIVIGLITAGTVDAQSQDSPPEFDVASVKPNRSMDMRAGELRTYPNRLSGTNVSLKKLIQEAYDLQEFQVAGPIWLDTERYDLEAKTEASASRQQLMLMLRALLEKRFKLVFQGRTKEFQVYALVVDENGPKVKPATAIEGSSGTAAVSGQMHFQSTLLSFCERLRTALSSENHQSGWVTINPQGVLPVVDRTGLDGVYDITLKPPTPATGDVAPWQNALREQLGLKLERQKIPIEILLIDHAEKVPTEN